MPIPHDPAARKFYRSAWQRFEEADLLMAAGRTTGAVYLAGYGVECILKALIFSRTPVSSHSRVIEQFKGSKAHQFEWLLDQYRARGGEQLTTEAHRGFRLVRMWATNLRYDPATIRRDRAMDFLAAARSIMKWADGRL